VIGMVHEPVDSGGGQRLGHQLVERGRVQYGADRDAAPLVGCIDQAVETFGGVRGRQAAARCCPATQTAASVDELGYVELDRRGPELLFQA
jgi:hypothetical protein